MNESGWKENEVDKHKFKLNLEFKLGNRGGTIHDHMMWALGSRAYIHFQCTC